MTEPIQSFFSISKLTTRQISTTARFDEQFHCPHDFCYFCSPWIHCDDPSTLHLACPRETDIFLSPTSFFIHRLISQ